MTQTGQFSATGLRELFGLISKMLEVGGLPTSVGEILERIRASRSAYSRTISTLEAGGTVTAAARQKLVRDANMVLGLVAVLVRSLRGSAAVIDGLAETDIDRECARGMRDQAQSLEGIAASAAQSVQGLGYAGVGEAISAAGGILPIALEALSQGGDRLAQLISPVGRVLRETGQRARKAIGEFTRDDEDQAGGCDTPG